MTAVTALVFYLRADPAVAALVGTRIYQVIAPQGAAFPHVVLTRISEPSQPQLRGDAGLTTTHVQIDCYANEADSASGDPKWDSDQVAAAVDAALYGRGPFASRGLVFPAVTRSNVRDTFDAEEVQAFRVMVEYFVTWWPAERAA